MILEERARKLAKPQGAPVTETLLEMVSFSVGVEKYMIETTFIKEISKLREYTTLPGTPDYVFGVTNIRGVVLALFDLSRFFSAQPKGMIDLTRIIVLGEDQMEFGILAERADQSQMLPLSAILPVSEIISAGTAKYLKGVTSNAVMVLDAKTLLNDERLIVDQQGGNP